MITWSQAIEKATGERMFGLPSAPGTQAGLMNRFLQGYAYPSYTGGEVTGFKSSQAVQMWQMLKRLWSVTNPQSTTYSQLQDLHVIQHPVGFLDFDNLPGLLLAVVMAETWRYWFRGKNVAQLLLVNVRAENIAVSHQRGDGALPAEVDVVEPLGSHLLLTLALGGQRLKAAARTDFAVEPHDQVWLRLEESSVRLLGRPDGGELAL